MWCFMSLLVVKFQIENVKVGGETSRWMASEIISVVKVVTYELSSKLICGSNTDDYYYKEV